MNTIGQTPVFFVIGPAGSGKSSFARALAVRIHGAYLDKDAICNTYTGVLLEEHGYDPSERDGNAYYRDELMPIEYESLLNVGSCNAKLGIPVIFDAPFGAFFNDVNYVKNIASKHNWPQQVHAVVIHISVDGKKVHQRLIERGLKRDSWKLDHWDSFWPKASGVTCTWQQATHITINNDTDREDFTNDVNAVIKTITNS
ncbi:AAA family ATPase [Bifidobacterium aquikefiri]|uniref:AAA family ATPase n=1 Tax=Bifidobacterium aquikefiri TaxID=1653207 RepID=A0A261G816_9BIFI|nr:AAA family ATPase [Bifidobacterium aquikefiri]OZG67571.1 AAA family ATPase [Bifidobacterium aquikefiri]